MPDARLMQMLQEAFDRINILEEKVAQLEERSPQNKPAPPPPDEAAEWPLRR